MNHSENQPDHNIVPGTQSGAPGSAAGEQTGDHLDQGAMRERQSGRRSNRRRGGGPAVSTIYWRDIPAQLTARSATDQSKVLLHARFQHAIDRAAAVAGLTTTDDYVREWRTVSSPLGEGDISAQLDQLCADIEGQYPKDRLEAFVANGGLDPDETPA